MSEDEGKMQQDTLPPEKTCYACGRTVSWLAPDGRCGRCTNMVPEEVTGEVL